MNPHQPLPYLDLQRLSKTYDGQRWALEELSLQLNAGQVVGLIGPNGSGKTTAISLMTGLRQPSQGQVWVCGHNIQTHTTEAKQHLAYVPDDTALVPNLTGWEYVMLTCGLYGFSVNEVQHYTQELFDLFGLSFAMHQPTESYSHGMTKKTQLIAALAHTPKLIILDEPLSGLDVESIVVVKQLIHKLKARSVAFVLSTHQLELATELCDRVYMLKLGQCIAQGTPTQIMTEQQVATLEQAFIKLSAADLPKEYVLDAIANRF